MFKPNLDKWQAFPNQENVIVFASSLVEMLYFHVIDTFRAKTLNTHSRLKEACTISNHYKNGKVPIGVFTPIIEELEYSFKKDIVLKRNKDLQNLSSRTLTVIKENLKNKEKVFSEFLALYEIFKIKYWNLLKDSIFKIVNEEKKTSEIYELAQIFSSEVELLGFSRKYLYVITNKYFFNPRVEPLCITTIDDLRKFISIFDEDSEDFIIITGVNKSIVNYKEFVKKIGIELIISNAIIENNFISYKYDAYLQTKEKAKDIFTAYNNHISNLELLKNFILLESHDEYIEWAVKSLRINEDKNILYEIKKPTRAMIYGKRKDKKIKRDISSLMVIIEEGKISNPAIQKLLRVVNYHRVALESYNNENTLIDLWASLEGFLPTPNEETARINQFIEYIIPSQILVYADDILRDIIYSIKKELKDSLPAFLSSLFPDIEKTDEYKIVSILLDEDKETERSQLYGLISQNPLLRYRCFWFNKYFSSTKYYYETLEHHIKLVKWHIQRIYTTRNHIMHSATSMPYIMSLIQSLHSYIDNMLDITIETSKQTKGNCSLNTIISMQTIIADSFLARVKESDIKINSINYRCFFNLRNIIS